MPQRTQDERKVSVDFCIAGPSRVTNSLNKNKSGVVDQNEMELQVLKNKNKIDEIEHTPVIEINPR